MLLFIKFGGLHSAYASIKPGLRAMGEKVEKTTIPLLALLFEVLNLCTKHKEKKPTASEGKLGCTLDDSNFLSIIESCIA